MKSKKRILYSVIILSVVLSVVAFKQLPQLFFASDEFLQLGAIRFYGLFAGLRTISPLRLLLGDGRPLGAIITNVFAYYFQTNTLPFILSIYLLQILNIMLVGTFVYRISKKLTVTVVSTLCFALPTTALQALSWLGAGVQTLGNLFFILLALHVTLTGIEKKSLRYTVLGWFFGYIAFLFKETAFFIFILLYILPFLMKQKNTILRKPITILITFGIFAFLALYKILPLITSRNAHQDSIHQIAKIVWCIIYYPLVSLSQFFIPFRFLSRAGLELSALLYPYASVSVIGNYVGTVIVGDLISVIASFVILIVLLSVVMKEKKYRMSFFLFTIFYVTSFLPIAVYQNDRGSSYIESRYLYLPYFAVSFYIGIVFDWIRTSFERISHKRVFSFMILFLLLALFLLKQIMIIQREVRQSYLFGKDIRETMTLLQKTVVTLPDNPVFFIDSDHDYFYPNNKLPFQLGTGYMVMLSLESHPQIPKKLLGNVALSAYFQEGYLESEGNYFGYFWDKKALKKAVDENNIQCKQIVGLFYHSNQKKFEDISASICADIRI
jgi:hypothetical protein